MAFALEGESSKMNDGKKELAERDRALRARLEKLKPEKPAHKQGEEPSPLSKEQWETTFDAIYDWVAIIDLKGQILYTNRAGGDFTGKSSTSIVGQSCCKLVHGSDKHIPGCPLEKMRRSRNRETIELHVLGTDRWVMVTTDPLTNAEGKIIGAVHITRDITERKKLEERLSTIIQTSPVPTAVGGVDGSIITFNEALETLIGYESFEVKDVADWANKLYPDKEYREFVRKNIKQALDGRKQDCTEFTITCKDGSTKVVDFYTSFFTGGLVIQMIDITERKKTQEALKESEQRYRAVFEQAPDSIVLIDAETGELVEFNGRAHEILGYTREEFRKLKISDFEIIESSDEVAKHIEKIVREGYDNFETKHITKNGQIRDVRVSSKAVSIGGKDFCQSIWWDITERKEAERKLFEHQAQLKSLASQLTLTEERERRQIAVDLHDHVSQSLSFSKMKLEALRKSESSAHAKQALGEVCDQLGQAIDSTRSLTFDLSSPVLYELGLETAVADWLKEQIEQKHGIKTEFVDDGQPKPLDDDIRALLFRDVRELLVNIVKHAHANKVKASIRKAGTNIQVSIEDDGIGFDPAETASMAARRLEFGLFNIHERLEELGGHLEIDSAPGGGCNVTITAPLKDTKK